MNKQHPLVRRVVFSFFMSVFMSTIMSFLMTLVNTGIDGGFPFRWMRACGIGFVAAFPTALLFTPITQRIVQKITGT